MQGVWDYKVQGMMLLIISTIWRYSDSCHMAQIFDERNIDETDEFLLQTFLLHSYS